MQKVFIAVLSVLLIAAPITGHAAQSDAAQRSDKARATSASKVEAGIADYVLQPQDVLKVQVFQEEEINRLGEAVRISKECTISLPLIGTLDIKGKTALQVREMVRERYDRDYLVDPQVQVFVFEYAKRFVTVVGQVVTPGPVQFPQEQGLTLVDAIGKAGGGTRLANLKKVVLKRTNPDGTPDVKTINVDELMKTESRDEYPLQPGDVITVPERSI